MKTHHEFRRHLEGKLDAENSRISCFNQMTNVPIEEERFTKISHARAIARRNLLEELLRWLNEGVEY